MTIDHDRPMNVLWLMADQMRADCAGFMGHPLVRTPHLDALAARGVVFEKAFAQAAICTPSRVSYFTSRYVHAHGAWWNGVPMLPGISCLPETLRQAGYRTKLMGKLHFYPQDSGYGFEEKEIHEEMLPPELSAYGRFLAQQNPPAPWPSEATLWDPQHPRSATIGVCQMPEELEETRWVAEGACRYLRGHKDEPFFLFASFIRPHSPYNPLPRFLEMYRDAPIEPPAFDRAELDQVPPRVPATLRSFQWDLLSPDDFRELVRHYYALCTQVDENVGRILDCLEAEGLADNTIVVWASDHGDFIGEHGDLHKMHLWDGSLHTHLVIYDPRRQGHPLRYSGLVESIDVMPTLLELLNLPIPEDLQGKSLLPVLNDPDQSHREAVFAEFADYTVTATVHEVLAACHDPNGVSVRTGRWKYIHYAGEDGELYDLADDPAERRNRFGDASLREVRAEMQQRLLDWRIAMPTNGYSVPQRDNPYFRRYFENMPPGMDARTERCRAK